MKITYLGTTVLLFDDGKNQIIFDAFFTRPPIVRAMFGKFKSNHKIVESIIKDFKINRLKAIFISHSHYDHVMDMPHLANETGATVYGSSSALNVARGGNVKEEQLISYVDQTEFKIGDFEIKVIPSIHSNPRWFNQDLGLTIDEPLKEPYSRKKLKEGGSFDFIVKHSGKTFLIRPSCNYINGQLDDIRADVMFLGIGGLNKEDETFDNKFYEETIKKVNPGLVLPIHFDNFFLPIGKKCHNIDEMTKDVRESLDIFIDICKKRKVRYAIQFPLDSMEM